MCIITVYLLNGTSAIAYIKYRLYYLTRLYRCDSELGFNFLGTIKYILTSSGVKRPVRIVYVILIT